MKTIILAAVLGMIFGTSVMAEENREPGSDINININLGKHKKHEPKKEEVKNDWLCSVTAFTETYQAVGNTKAVAKMKVMQKCQEENDEMHCDEVKCENEEDNNDTGWICTLKVFTKTFQAAGTRGEAKLKVLEKCKESEGESSIFCKDPKCEEG